MNKTLRMAVLLFVAALSFSHAYAQETKADSTVNVIAWYCLHDTVIYRQREQELRVENGDTTIVTDAYRRYQFIVVDSTSKGFLLEYMPLAFEFPDDDPVAKMKYAIAERFIGIRILISTDELGQVKQVENFKEVHQAVYSRCDSLIDEIYREAPTLYAQMSKPDMLKKLHKQLDDTYGSRQRLLESMDVLEVLFNYHGKSFSVGKVEDVSGNTTSRLRVTTGKADDNDETATDDDYQISQYITIDESKDGQSPIHEVVVHKEYFNDGWPRYVYISDEEGDDQHLEISRMEIDWEYRGWE